MSYQGKLLVAHPRFPLQSPFCKSVVYIYQDDAVNGTVGVVLNKMSQISVQDICANNNVIYPDKFPKVFLGGPVNTNALVILHTDEWASTNTTPAGKGLRVSSDPLMFEKLSLGDQPAYWRCFMGISGWAMGQLDAEMNGHYPFNEKMWLTAQPNDDILFRANGDKQWKDALDLCSQQTIDQWI